MTLTEWKKDFKEYIDALMLPRDDYRGIMEYIDEAPANDGEWIPCSERLPRENGDYLVTFKYLIFYPVEVCEFKDGKWDSGMYDVVAWQFIPDPYKPPKEET